MKISTGYINLPLDKVEDSIKESLQELGEFASADRAYIFDIDFARAHLPIRTSGVRLE